MPAVDGTLWKWGRLWNQATLAWVLALLQARLSFVCQSFHPFPWGFSLPPFFFSFVSTHHVLKVHQIPKHCFPSKTVDIEAYYIVLIVLHRCYIVLKLHCENPPEGMEQDVYSQQGAQSVVLCGQSEGPVTLLQCLVHLSSLSIDARLLPDLSWVRGPQLDFGPHSSTSVPVPLKRCFHACFPLFEAFSFNY